MGDSLSNASASLNRLDEDDENSSRIRESLKKELKLIQNAKKDLKVKRVRDTDGSHARSSHTIVHQ